MKVSIIVPVYNVEKYLQRCLDSLVGQSLDSYEIILVDDGSTDASPDIMREYAVKYPELIKTKTVSNGGQGRARNFGLELADGDYLGFVDSDDWVEKDMFLKLYEAAEQENADIAVCDIIKIFDDGTTLYHPAATADEPLAAAGSVCNKLFRRSLIGRLRFPENMWYEDFDFSAKLLLTSQSTVFLHEPLYCYRVGQQSTMNNNNARMNLDIIAAAEDVKGYISKANLSEDIDYVILNHILLDAINRTAKQNSRDKDEVIRKLRAYVHENIPALSQNMKFKKQGKGRRLAMLLNYLGLEALTQLLLKIKNQ